jgi:histidine triad (HIT) family protein
MDHFNEWMISSSLEAALNDLHAGQPSCPDAVKDDECVFCEIVAGRAPQTRVWEGSDAIAIRPRPAPINEGHLLIIPRRHVADAAEDPALFGRMAAWAAYLSLGNAKQFNIYTSAGADASQTVFHLHVHLVPREKGDGVTLARTD